MKKHYFYSSAITVVLIVVVALFTGTKEDNSPENLNDKRKTSSETEVSKNNFSKSYPVKLPEQINFAGEQVPLNDMDVSERLDREMLVNIYWQSQTIYYLKLSNRWFPVIEPILKQNGVPDDFKYVALAESGLQNVISPSDAVGVWQFLKGTAKDYGLEINEEIDERYNLEKATEAACKYFLDGYKEFGNWTAAAASYNVGLARIKEQSALQNSKNYYDLWLNNETSRYIFRALAFKEILNNSSKYGFEINKEDLYSPIRFKFVKMDSSITDLPDFARQQNVSYKMFKMFNPWLRRNYLKNEKKKEYQIKLPA